MRKDVEKREEEEERVHDTPHYIICVRCCGSDQLWRRYEETDNPETRTRYQMLMLAKSGQTAPQIARLVLRSEETVEHVLKRFLAGGLNHLKYF